MAITSWNIYGCNYIMHDLMEIRIALRYMPIPQDIIPVSRITVWTYQGLAQTGGVPTLGFSAFPWGPNNGNGIVNKVTMKPTVYRGLPCTEVLYVFRAVLRFFGVGSDPSRNWIIGDTRVRIIGSTSGNVEQFDTSPDSGPNAIIGNIIVNQGTPGVKAMIKSKRGDSILMLRP